MFKLLFYLSVPALQAYTSTVAFNLLRYVSPAAMHSILVCVCQLCGRLVAHISNTDFEIPLLTCLLTVWVETKKPSPVFSYGYERFEVLAVFSATVLAQLGSLFVIKESVERLLLHQPEIHTGRLMVGAGLAFMCHLVVTYGCRNAALDHVIAASSSSWLQEHVSDISQTLVFLSSPENSDVGVWVSAWRLLTRCG
ncbi:unnamed protein product [Timema podura]|uniref:Cation efflux protein transmembrane domain-containing protein n=1 Tax=Timema podura TaxID=61482 RepID=A0ABN7NU50_TIMPD|nr:unnamed protein product [Timema podura]